MEVTTGLNPDGKAKNRFRFLGHRDRVARVAARVSRAARGITEAAVAPEVQDEPVCAALTRPPAPPAPGS